MTESAQRDLEQRALRNVRGLVDKMESDDALQRLTQRRIFIGIVVGTVLIACLLGYGLMRADRNRAQVLLPTVPAGAAKTEAPRTTP